MKRVRRIQETHLFRVEYICSRRGAAYSKPYEVYPKCQPVMGRAKHDPSRVDEAEGLSALPDDNM